jgi:hypothetical protein
LKKFAAFTIQENLESKIKEFSENYVYYKEKPVSSRFPVLYPIVQSLYAVITTMLAIYKRVTEFL